MKYSQIYLSNYDICKKELKIGESGKCKVCGKKTVFVDKFTDQYVCCDECRKKLGKVISSDLFLYG